NNSFENKYSNLFEELSPIGSGGFGTVYKVKHKIDKQLYAVKILKFENVIDEYLTYIYNEMETLKQKRSEYVVKYFNSWRDDNIIYTRMELCSQNLKNILEVKPQVFDRQSGEAMDCVEYFISCEIYRQILESVQYLHELNPQIIHRDLKPENILITENVRNGRFIKLCDFGLATVHDKRIHYRTSNKHTPGVCTLKYQAPEIVQGNKYGHKADIYSLALIGGELFELDTNE
ncbi:unnamed protein product, partial [Oppiella nova]